MSDILHRLLIKEEGFSPYVYLDTKKLQTIGIGCLVDKRMNVGITEEEALYLLDNRLKAIFTRLDAEIPWWRQLNEVRQAILVSMAYQLGVGGLLSFKRTLKAVQEGRFADAAAAMRLSLWYRQTPARAERAAKGMESGLTTGLGL